MLVKNLINILAKLSEDTEIILSKDSEGNEYKTIDEVALMQTEDKREFYIIYPTDNIIDL